MKHFENIDEAIEFGFEVEKSISGQYRLMYDGHVVFEDPANEDMYDYDMAVEYMLDPANEYAEDICKYLGSIVDLGSGANLVEDEEFAHEVKLMVDKFGCNYHRNESNDFEDTCHRLGLEPNNVTRVGFIGDNVCACICIGSDWKYND